MKLSGNYPIPVSREKVWAHLTSSESLLKSIPGCKKLKETKPHHFQTQIEVGLAGISGIYDGEVGLTDLHPPVRFRMSVQGQGKGGHVKGTGEIHLEQDGEKTQIHYAGDMQIGGVIAAVGQRLLQVAARRLTQQFFENLGKLTRR